MKSIFKSIGLALTMMAALPACEIDRLPETSISDQTFWRSEADLRSAANYLYTFLPGWATDDVWSDDAFGSSANSISDGSRLAPATDGSYNNNYNLIRVANNIVEKASRAASTTSTAVIDRYLAEARFFRAWGYYNLFQRYGGVPLILKTLDDNSPELQAPANTRSEVIAQIYQDLDFAAQKLPTPTALGNADYGRISNTAALAFKARVALFEGTRSKFHSYGNPATHLQAALDASKSVIDSKQHDLFSGSYFDLFQLAGKGRQNRENVLVRPYGVSPTEQVSTHNYYRSALEGGTLTPTKALADAYLMKDGLPITKSPLYKTPQRSIEVFQNRDERMNATFLKAGDSYMVTKPIYDVADLSRQRTGFTFRKTANLDDWNTQTSLVDRPLLRYAEVLLIYAEATYELNNSISDTDLDLSVNRLRQRGGLPKLSEAFIKVNGLTMRDELRRERRVELAQEGFRYWDLIRWKTAEVELPKPVIGNYFFRSEFGSVATPQLTPDNYILVQAATFRKFDPAKDYLWPLPINEIALNPALKQNSGW
ncbi:RagB/SusD family nutrient uptake outer membrane protein [Larkinella sp. GY13]|uniref:RagB/SusD family nutrient uptake outer membrane protein n=1 Tax=Larkinella sp. GY13 TaxID=3453720 RepID=UPI003EEB2FB4